MSSDGNNGFHSVHLEFDGTVITSSPGIIRCFDDIPDILTMDIPPIKYLVDGMIPRGAMVLWAGSDGVAKTYLAQKLAVAVATGGKFLGRGCQQAPVLILDYENPSYIVRKRLDVLTGGPIGTKLKVWGTWLPEQPPQIGSELLLTIAQETQPLIIVDPFRYAHGAEENDSTEMMAVMQQLRYCAVKGAAVVILHHVAKVEGSNGRGSSAIRGAVDVGYIQSVDGEHGLILLKCDKNRFGEAHYTITIRPDFEEGKFEVTNSPEFDRRNQELEAIRKIIEEQPGLSQNAICDKSGMKKARVCTLLKENSGTLWVEEGRGNGRAKRYFLLPVPTDGNRSGTGSNFPPSTDLFPCSPPYRGNSWEQGQGGCSHEREQVPPNGHPKEGPLSAPGNGPPGLPSCPKCGSTALYRLPGGGVECQTCLEAQEA